MLKALFCEKKRQQSSGNRAAAAAAAAAAPVCVTMDMALPSSVLEAAARDQLVDNAHVMFGVEGRRCFVRGSERELRALKWMAVDEALLLRVVQRLDAAQADAVLEASRLAVMLVLAAAPAPAQLLAPMADSSPIKELPGLVPWTSCQCSDERDSDSVCTIVEFLATAGAAEQQRCKPPSSPSVYMLSDAPSLAVPRWWLVLETGSWWSNLEECVRAHIRGRRQQMMVLDPPFAPFHADDADKAS